MRRPALILFVLICCLPLSAQTHITFVPQWTPQAQFAGYYIALEKGYYAEEGLDVDIRHLGVNSTLSSQALLEDGSAQIVGLQLLPAIVARSKGVKLRNVFQLTQNNALWCVSHTPIISPLSLDGLKIGKWKVGYSEICDIVQNSLGLDVQWVPFIKGINLYVYGAVDATLCYSYSEFIQLRLAVGDIPQDHILKFSEWGYNYPEDGLYVMDRYYARHSEDIDKFVRASKRGWDYVREHQEEALDLCWRYIDEAHVSTNETQQRLMLQEYLRLQVNQLTGEADYAPCTDDVFDSIVGKLLNAGLIDRSVSLNELYYEGF